MTAQMKVLGLWILWAIGNSETLPAKWRREVIHKIVKQNKQNWSPSNTRKSSRTRKEIERSGWSQRYLLSAKRTTHWKRLDSRWPGAFCTDPPLVGKWKTTTKMRKCGKQKMEKKTRKKKRKKHWGLGWGYRWRAAGRFPRRSSTCDRASCTGRVRRLPATRGGWSAVDTTRWTPYRQVLSSSTVSSCRPPFAPSAMASVIFEESMVSSSSVMVIPPPPTSHDLRPNPKEIHRQRSSSILDATEPRLLLDWERSSRFPRWRRRRRRRNSWRRASGSASPPFRGANLLVNQTISHVKTQQKQSSPGGVPSSWCAASAPTPCPLCSTRKKRSERKKKTV